MKVVLPKKIKDKLSEVIVTAGKNEIGGILMGEYLSDDEYRIVDYTVQNKKGNIFTFVRYIADIIQPLKMFFKKTNFNYKKYNYLGEWHSHPSFSLQPSSRDMESMWEIVNDPSTNANFAVLVIFQVNNESSNLKGSSTVFLPGQRMTTAELIYE